MEKIINEIRNKVPSGIVTGIIVVDGEYDSEFGNYHIGFELSSDNRITFGNRITFHNEEGGLEAEGSPEEIITNGLNWWIEPNV